MHTIFENQYYLPQQMWVYLYNILLTVVANSFVLHSKQSKIKTILLQSVLFYLLLIPQHFDNMPSWTMQLSLLTIVTGNLLLYKDRFYVKIITSIVSILIIFLSDYLSYFIVAVLFGSSENYLQEPYVYLVSVTVITTLLSVYTIIGSRFLKKNRDMFFRSNIVFLFVLIAFEILFLAFSITQFNQVSTYVPFNVKNTNLSIIYFYIFIFIVTDSILIYFTKSSALYYKIKSENEMLEYQNKLQAEYYRKMLENYESTAKLRHDINNLVQVINIQLSENTQEGNKKAKEIVSGISDIMDSTKTQRYCSNEIVNAVLFDKTSVAKEESIKIIDDIILDNNTGIADFDICRVFINLLDNSINALKNYTGDDKLLYLSCKQDNDHIFIKCENKFSETIRKPEKNPELHGYGMKIVKDITEKYNGELITQIQDTTFSTLAILKTE